MTEATRDSGLPGTTGPNDEPLRRAMTPLRHRVDFDRPLVPVLGLPFDAISLPQAVERIRDHIGTRTRCFVSTPNLNFVAAALADRSFRDTVLRSDLSLVDGMPLVWIARWCGTPVPGRVAGADVFEALMVHTGPPIKVYLFGGPEGAAAQACAAINRRAGGMQCVGFDPAGFGTVESMSTDAQIERINRSGADFVVASLGAKKGQAWLEHNAAKLTAPVLAHLGAAINFAAGTVRRAPAWMRWSGVEWLWRIKEEPSLWRRYWRDGTLLLGVLVTRVLPDVLASRVLNRRAPTDGAGPTIDLNRTAGSSTLRLSGSLGAAGTGRLRVALAEAAAHADAVRIDLHGVEALSGPAVALLLLAKGWFGSRGGFAVVGASAGVRAAFRRKLVAKALFE